MKRPIAISLAPNMEEDDVVLAKRLLLSPSKCNDPKDVESFESQFENYFGNSFKAFSVNSGRSALYIILKALGINKGDEVIIQAFTCVAVPNSILWAGAKPIYVDIGDDYNLDIKDLKKKISKSTKAIVVQHTFGIPADINSIKEVIKNKKIFLIEDCAHSLGANYGGRKIGTLGDVSLFSFGRDKVISSVFGGTILSGNDIISKRVKEEVLKVNNPSFLWTFQQLLHPVLFSIILPLYNVGLDKLTVGKLLLFLFQKIKLLSFPVYRKERFGGKPSVFPQKMSGALAALATNQLKKLGKFNEHRKKIADFYLKELRNKGVTLPPKLEGAIWIRFPIKVRNAKELYIFAKEKGILLGNWYKEVVMPVNSTYSAGYVTGSCPNAEKITKEIINLPTYPTLSIEEANNVVQLVKLWISLK